MTFFAFAALVPESAHACGNAVEMDADERIATVAKAQSALDEGDVDRAGDLARDVLEHTGGTDVESARRTSLLERATRIDALSRVRDRSASAAERSDAESVLASLVSRHQPADPTLVADHAEAMSRLPDRKDEAFATLRDLQKKDLVGSPWALGALHRLAHERHDEVTASRAISTCTRMVGASRVCNGDYAEATKFRLRPLFYAMAASLALLLAFRMLVVRLRHVSRAESFANPRLTRRALGPPARYGTGRPR